MTQPPALVVVRGGTSQTFARVKSLLEEAVEDGDGAVLSVFAEPRASAHEAVIDTVERICRNADVPHSRVLVSDSARLGTVGLPVVLSVDDGEPMNHHHVIFTQPLDDAQIEAYLGCWDDSVPNPTGGRVKS